MRTRAAIILTTVVALTGCTTATNGTSDPGGFAQRARVEKQEIAATPDGRLRQSCLSSGTDASGGSGARWATRADTDVVVASDQTAELAAFTRNAQDAHRAVATTLEHTSRHSLLVLVPHTEAQYQQWVGSGSEGKQAETVMKPGCLPYVVIAPQRVARPNDPIVRETLTHESVHALSLTLLVTDRPLWVSEGMAEYVGQAAVNLPGHPDPSYRPKLPTQADLTGADAGRAYDAAWQFFVFLEQTYGRAKVTRFYDAAIRTTEPLDAIFRSVFGASQPTLEKRYAAWYAPDQATK